jgi:hypothetical protein
MFRSHGVECLLLLTAVEIQQDLCHVGEFGFVKYSTILQMLVLQNIKKLHRH